MYKKQLVYFIAMFLCGISAKAQVLEVGAIVGGSGYLGDLNQNKPLKISGISAGAFVKANINPYWAFGLHYTYGKIKADDTKSDNQDFRDRGLNFSTALNEVSLQVDFNFFEYFAGGGTKIFSPYIFTGIGGVLYNPRATYPEYNGVKYDNVKLRPYKTEKEDGKDAVPYKNYSLTIPYGVGVKVRLKENWGLFSQIGYRTAYTDYLDDVSGKYPSTPANPYLSNPTAANGYGPVGSQRGDFRKRDTYMFVGIGISYTFVSQKCYTF
jgi:hypothetical protein